MIVVLMGGPGSGKGTQARMLHERIGWPHISTGDMLREIAREDSPLGHEVARIQAAGELVSDAVLADVVRDRTSHDDCSRGYILDGFPRTFAQGETLDALATEQNRPVRAVLVKVAREELLRRLTGRRSCPSCGEIYNLVSRPPSRDGVCDNDDTPLLHRSDDNEESVSRRLEVYAAATRPLVLFYEGSGRLTRIDGGRDPEDVYVSLVEALGIA